MAIIGIIGIADPSEEIVRAGLQDLLDKSLVDGEETFWGIVGITTESQDASATALQWFLDEQIAYDLVYHPDVELDAVPPEWVDSADNKTAIKGVWQKVVTELQKNGGTHLLVLLDEEQEADDEFLTVLTKAEEGGLQLLNLADGLSVLTFEPEPAAEPAPAPAAAKARGTTKKGGAAKKVEPEPDLLEIGTTADEDEGEAGQTAMEELTTLAKASDLDPDAYETWTELAQAIVDLGGEGQPAQVGWTEEDLAGKNLRELRLLASRSEIEGASKMTAPALKKALLALGDAATPDVHPEAPEEAPEAAVAPATRKGRTTRAKSPGTPLNGTVDTGDGELNDILAGLKLSVDRLVTHLSS